MTSLQAALMEEEGRDRNAKVNMFEAGETLLKALDEAGKGEKALNQRIALKRAKYHRAKEKEIKGTEL
jgi:hypothetical protein